MKTNIKPSLQGEDKSLAAELARVIQHATHLGTFSLPMAVGFLLSFEEKNISQLAYYKFTLGEIEQADPVVVVHLDAGTISVVNSDKPVRVVFLDADTEGGSEDKIIEIASQELYVSDYLLDEEAFIGGDGIDVEYVDHVVKHLDGLNVVVAPSKARP